MRGWEPETTEKLTAPLQVQLPETVLWTAMWSVWVPAGSLGMVTDQPELVKRLLPKAAATSGRAAP